MIYLINSSNIIKIDFENLCKYKELLKDERVLIHFKSRDNRINYINKLYYKDFNFYPDILYKHDFYEASYGLDENELEIIKFVFKYFYSHNIFVINCSDEKLDQVLTFLKKIPFYDLNVKFKEQQQHIIDKVMDNLKLSVTQKNEFINLVKKYKVREGNILVLKEYEDIIGENKRENKKIYEDIRRKLFP